MTADEARLHLRYTRWASLKLLEAAAALTEEQRSREVGVSHASIAGTLSHIYFGDRVWYSRVAEPDLPYETGAPWDDLAPKWTDILERWQRWAASIDDAGLLRVVDYRTQHGDPHYTPVWQIVLHVVNHATLHRGQVMATIRQFGVKPPATDLIFFYRELTAAAQA